MWKQKAWYSPIFFYDEVFSLLLLLLASRLLLSDINETYAVWYTFII
jgi:hypothetical protein